MATVKPVIWAPRAEQDLTDIWRYYARVASPDVADKMLREIEEATRNLGCRNVPGRARDEIRRDLRSVLSHPYSIFFRIADSTIEIVRVLHERRDYARILSGSE